MPREFVESWEEGDITWEVYKDDDGYIIEGTCDDGDYEDFYSDDE